MYWPGWKAAIDGQPGKLGARPSSGNIALAVPGRRHAVTPETRPSPVRLAAELLSLAAVVATTIMLIAGGRTTGDERQRQTERGMTSGTLPPRPPPNPLRCPLFVVLSPSSSPPVARDRRLLRGDPTWDGPNGLFNHNPGGDAFTDGARLYGPGYSADEIAGREDAGLLPAQPGSVREATSGLDTGCRPAHREGAAGPPELVCRPSP